jgi:Domain of Unknown Function with PDB structure (DUF3858)
MFRSAWLCVSLLMIAIVVSTVAAQEGLPDGVDGRLAILIPAGVDALVAAGQMEDRFLPEEKAVYLYRGDDYQLRAGGQISCRRQRLVLIRDASALAEFVSIALFQDQQNQNLILHQCRTHLPDGEILTGSVAGDGRIRPAGLVQGCVLELDLEWLDRDGASHWLEGRVSWQHRHRALLQLISVSYPSHLNLSCGAIGKEVEPVIQRGDEYNSYLWQVDNMKGRREPFLTAWGTGPPAQLIFSTCPSWESLSSKVMTDFSGALTSDSTMTAWAERSLYNETALTRTERVEAVLNRLRQSAETIQIAPLTPLSYRPARPATDCFQVGSSNRWDQAALAVKLFGSAQVRCWVALRASEMTPLPNVPALCQFDQILLKTRAWPDTLFVNPVTTEPLPSPYSWNAHPLLMLSHEAPRWQHYAVSPGAMDLDVALNLDAAGTIVSGTAELVLSGPLIDLSELADPVEFGRQYLARLLPVSQLDGCELLAVGPDHSRLRFRFSGQVGQWRNGRLYLNLSAGPAGLAQRLAPLNLHLPQRSEPLFLDTSYEERVTWRIHLPPELQISYLPTTAAITMAVGEFRLAVEQHESQRFDLAWSLTFPMLEIPPARYEEFRDLLRSYQTESQKLVILTARQ